jgi:hypothetical protein
MKHLNDGLYSGPLVVFDEFGKVLVISSFNQFMAASYEHDVTAKTVSWGIMGKVNEVSPGFMYSTIIVYGSQGFNKVIFSKISDVILNSVLIIFTIAEVYFILRYHSQFIYSF